LLNRKDDEFRLGYAEIYVVPEEAEEALQTIKNNEAGSSEEE